MKTLITLLITIIIGSGYLFVNGNTGQVSINPAQLQTFEPVPGNDGEDDSERSFMCRLFNYFCPESQEE